jgi:TatA/E family protein of Tat protein translocase
MFGLGMPEILLILAIALMVIGPKKLPELAKTLGRAMGEFKKAAQDFKRSIDLEETARKFEEPAKSIRETIKEVTTSPEETPATHSDAATPADPAPLPGKVDDTPTGERISKGDGAEK